MMLQFIVNKNVATQLRKTTADKIDFEGIAPIVTPLDVNVPDETIRELLENV
jgi:hypothetical protein